LFLTFILFSCGKRNDYQETINLGEDWSFYPQKKPISTSPSIEDVNWQEVDLLTGEESNMPINNSTIAEMQQPYDSETGWYRKNFIIDEKEKGRIVYLFFNNIFPDPELWLNGEKIDVFRKSDNSQLYRINDLIKYNHENLITIREDSSLLSSFPPGSSDYYFRQAQLILANQVHVLPGGIKIKPSGLDRKRAELEISVQLRNETPDKRRVKIISHIYHPDDGKVAVINSDGLSLDDSLNVVQMTSLENPEYSNISDPVIYECVTDILTSGNTILDTYVERFIINRN
jgi:hypothetical protein